MVLKGRSFRLCSTTGKKSIDYYLCPMKFKAEINVMPHKELLDPQGKTVARNMDHVGINGVQDVRIGKRIEIALEATDETAARAIVDQACQKFLANLIMETYSFEVKPA